MPNLPVSEPSCSIDEAYPLPQHSLVLQDQAERLRASRPHDTQALLDAATSASSASARARVFAEFVHWRDHAPHVVYHDAVEEIMVFLTQLFLQGKAYSTIASARTAIVQALNLSRDLANDGRLRRFLRGVRTSRPPAPRYDGFWDPSILLHYIAVNLGDNTVLSLDDLRSKAITLMAMAILGRASDLQRLLASSIAFDPDGGMSIRILNPKELSGGGISAPLMLPQLPDADAAVCPVRTLRAYMWRTRKDRERLGGDPVFLYLPSPRRAVRPLGAQAIAKCILIMLSRAGIDTRKYKAHSVRGAAASSALDAGVDIATVLLLGRWADVGNFQRFYNRAQYAESVVGMIRRNAA